MTDAVGIPLERRRLRELTSEYLRRLSADDESLTAEDYLTMIRLWNTIEFGHLSGDDPLFRQFAAAFFPSHVARATELLALTPTKGMALHSAKHDIFLGGQPHANSQYRMEG